MFPTKRDPLSSVSSDDFSVHSGPSHVKDWPLAHSASHDHYIKPVPPFYVTEYEASYKWPSPPKPPLIHTESDQDATETLKDSGLQKERSDEGGKDDEEKYKVVTPPLATVESPWQTMEEALDDLTFLERETVLASQVKPEVHEHKLDDKIEEAYKHYRKRLIMLEKQPSTHGVRKEVVERMKAFCDSVEAVKQAHAPAPAT